MLAHEIGHVRNRDILISSVAATLAGAITLIARMGYWASLFGGGGGRDDRDRGGGFVGLLMLILAPIAATLIQLAVSRSREYEADASGASYTGNPYALASALKKLDAYSKRIPMQATPSTAHLFIVAPLLGIGLRQSVFDPSADCQAHRAPDGTACGTPVLKQRRRRRLLFDRVRPPVILARFRFLWGLHRVMLTLSRMPMAMCPPGGDRSASGA